VDSCGKEALRKGWQGVCRTSPRRVQILYEQGIWIFGDWDRALLAAGFDPRKMRVRRLWDHERVVKEIRGLRDRKLPLYAKYVMEQHTELFSSARRHFGSWSRALRAAGITQAPRKAAYRSRLTILRTLRDALEKGLKKDLPQTLRVEAAHYFGTLLNAQRALKKDPKLGRGWSKGKIIAFLRSKDSLAYAGRDMTLRH
jgi:hypothetical protein